MENKSSTYLPNGNEHIDMICESTAQLSKSTDKTVGNGARIKHFSSFVAGKLRGSGHCNKYLGPTTMTTTTTGKMNKLQQIKHDLAASQT